jgi:DNA-binding PadR family transcriptional regulator
VLTYDTGTETPRLSHKALLLLGLLLQRPMTGYDLNRIARAHGHLYADLKKGNIYHLLDGLARQGHLRVTVQPGARGPRRERLVYELTPDGREAFLQLLREVLTSFEPAFAGLASAVVFLPELDREEALGLLRQRRELVFERRRLVASELSSLEGALLRLAGDHLLATIDTELAWVDEALGVVARTQWPGRPGSHPEADGRCPASDESSARE